MRKVAAAALMVLASVIVIRSAPAESASRDQCVTLCKEAAKFINEKGYYPAVAEINNKAGKFVTKETYVFLMDMEGHLLAHPMNPQFIGVDMTVNKDKDGKLFVKEMLEVAKTKGEGWTEYMYPKPEELQKPTPYKEKAASKKLSFVYRIPGKDVVAVAGIFE